MSRKNKELVCASALQHRFPSQISAAEPTVTRDGAKEAFRALRAGAQRNGVQELTLDEINEEIRQARCGEES